MNGVLTLAGLTIREAMRKKVFIASLLIAAIFVFWALLPMPIRPGMMTGPDEAHALDFFARLFAWFGCGMIKFFSSVLAVTLAAGALTAEIERGVLAVVVPKPMSRMSIYFGKWLGLLTILAGSVLLWSTLLILGIWHKTHIFHPHILLGILATCLFPLLFVTLTLCFSSFASFALSAGLALIAAGVSLAEDILYALSRGLDVPVLDTISKVVGYIVPLGKMNHWITRGLGNAGYDWSAFAPSRPGESAIATGYGDLTYIICYIIAATAIGVLVFQRRDL